MPELAVPDLGPDDSITAEYAKKAIDWGMNPIEEVYRNRGILSLFNYPVAPPAGAHVTDQWFRENAPRMSDDEFRENAVRILEQKLAVMILQRNKIS